MGVDDTRGIIPGSHPSFTATEARYGNQYTSKAYNSVAIHELDIGISINRDINVIGFKENGDVNKDVAIGEQSYHEREKRKMLTQESVESAGNICNYRCINCRECGKCKQGDNIKAISLREEYEQHIIDKSVIVDIRKGVSCATLPLVERPEAILVPNKTEALKIFPSEQNRLEKCPKSKEDVIALEKKLQGVGYVEYVENFTADQQNMA